VLQKDKVTHCELNGWVWTRKMVNKDEQNYF